MPFVSEIAGLNRSLLLLLPNTRKDLTFDCYIPSISDWISTGGGGYTSTVRKGEEEAMSRNNGKNSRLDLKINLSQPRGNPSSIVMNSPNRSSTSSSPSSSPPSSCVSSESEQGSHDSSLEATSMVLVGCPRCLMYVMLSEDDPKCPKCKSSVLLDFNDHKSEKKTRK